MLHAKLPALHDRALKTMRARPSCPVRTYLTIAREVSAVDLTSEGSELVRRRFNAYYGVRRNSEWRSLFYTHFEVAKQSRASAKTLFSAIIAEIADATGRVEASFVSKLVATLRPESPIVDSVVRGWLETESRPPAFGSGLKTAIDYYEWLDHTMADLAGSAEAAAWSAVFERTYPAQSQDPPVSKVKQLDFLIWAGAER